MNRSISIALMIALCVSTASAQAAAPKGKVGAHKPVGVAKTPSGGFQFGNVTHPIVNTPPKAILGINHLPVFPVFNPPRLPEGGHGPVVLNPPKHGPINGLPVPYKPPHKHWNHCNDWFWCLSMHCGNCWESFCFDYDCYDSYGDFCWDMN